MSAKTKATAAEAASLKRLIERYDRPGARERGLQILAREMDAATEIKNLGAPLGPAYVGIRGALVDQAFGAPDPQGQGSALDRRFYLQTSVTILRYR